MRTSLLLLCVGLAACAGQTGNPDEDSEGFGNTLGHLPILQLDVRNAYPYDITSTSARIHFETNGAINTTVTLTRVGGPAEAPRTFVENGPRSDKHDVSFGGLSPCGHYRYTISDGVLSSASFDDLYLYDVNATFGPSVHADLTSADVTFYSDLPTDLTVQVTDLHDRQVSIAADFSTRTAHRVHVDGLQPHTTYRANVYHQLGCFTWMTEFATATNID